MGIIMVEGQVEVAVARVVALVDEDQTPMEQIQEDKVPQNRSVKSVINLTILYLNASTDSKKIISQITRV
jgi:hypothetical protein